MCTRDASTEANKKLEAFAIESHMREDVYQSLLKYKAKGEKLAPEDQRRTPLSLLIIDHRGWGGRGAFAHVGRRAVTVLDKQLEDFERNGLGLPKEEREKLKAIKTSTYHQWTAASFEA